MGEQHQIPADLVGDRASSTTDPVKNLRTGATFYAEIEGESEQLIPPSDLGNDGREVLLVHVNSDAEAYAILPQDEFTFTLFGVLNRGRILRRRDNAASVQTDFWAMQLVKGKDY